MPQETGTTYGFGRVSPRTRPSPYTPVHLATGSPAHGMAAEATRPAARVRRRRWLGVVALALVVAASALTAAGFLRASARATAEAARAPAPVLLAEDDEAARLARSAIALSGAALRR